VRPTRYGVLAALAVLVGAVTWGVLRVLDSRSQGGTLPALPWTAPVALLLLAVGIAVAALSLRGRLQGREGTRPVNPLQAARMAVLSKAASHAGALFVGLYAGVLVFLLPDLEADLRRTRAATAGLGILGSLALVAAGLFLERVCRLPEDRDDDPQHPVPPT
jgi:hypothetical protein